MKITELPLRDEIIKAIEEMGYKEPTPIQEKALPILLAGKDVEAEAPTGTGKTACYSLPLLNKLQPNGQIQGLVLCPTRELAKQVEEEINRFGKYVPGVKTLAIFGGQSINVQIMGLKKKKPSIIVGTPGRMLDLIKQGKLDISHVSYLVLDECDEMLDMGFIRDINSILSAIKTPHQTGLFSATISPEIKKISRRYLAPDYESVKVVRDSSHQHQIAQRYLLVSEFEKKGALVNLIDELSFDRAFVFCKTKRKVMEIEKILKLNTDHRITSLQGNLSQNKRDANMASFRDNKTDIMVATDIAARGIDVSDVDVVINFDVPMEDEFYLHRIGRTGRVDAKGTSFTFLTPRETNLIGKYAKLSGEPLTEYVLDKGGDSKAMKKYLDSLKPLLAQDKAEALKELEDAAKEFSAAAKRVVTPEEVAAMILIRESQNPVTTVTSKFEKSKEGRHSREPDDRDAAPADADGNQRFFINLGTNDGLDEDGLKEFVTANVPEVTKDDFADVFLKEAYSFLTLPDKFSAKLMDGLNGRNFNGREVSIEKAQQRKTSGGYGHSHGRFSGHGHSSYGGHRSSFGGYKDSHHFGHGKRKF